MDRSSPTPDAASRPGAPGRDVWPLLLPAAVGLITFLIFSPALAHEFIDFDDDWLLTHNPHFRGLAAENIRWALTTFHGTQYMPLTWLSWSLTYAVFGMNASGYILINILLHASGAAIFYLLTLELLTLAGTTGGPAPANRAPAAPPTATGPEPLWILRTAAAVAALFFAVHPLRVESVAWITERKDVLSGFFVLLTLLSYVRARGRPVWRTFVLYALALLCKPIAVTLPPVLLALDYYPLRRLPHEFAQWPHAPCRRILLEKLPYLALALPFIVLAPLAAVHQGHLNATALLDLPARLALVCYGPCFYLYKSLLPVALSPLYELPERLRPFSWPYPLCALLVVTVTALVIAGRRRRPAFLAAWFAYVAVLSPNLGLIHVGPQMAADRFTYLSCLPWALLAAGLLRHLLRRSPSTLAALSTLLPVALLLALLAALTVRQLDVWQNKRAFWSHVLAVNPDSAHATARLGAIHLEAGDFDAAIGYYRAGLRLRPENPNVRTALANALFARLRLDESELLFRESLARRPDDVFSLVSLANNLLIQQRPSDALPYYQRALELIPPDSPDRPKYAAAVVACQRVIVALAQDRLLASLDELQTRLRTHPDDHAARLDLTEALRALGRLDDSIAECRTLLARQPDSARAHAGLGLALQKLGRHADATDAFLAALALDRALPEVYIPLSDALAAQGLPDDALAVLRSALRELDPNRHADAIALVRRRLAEIDGRGDTAAR